MDTTSYQKPEFIPEEGTHHLSFFDLMKLSLRVFRMRPMRTFLTVAGMAVGIGTVFFLVSLGYGLQYILIGKLASTEDSLVSLEGYYPQESNLSISQDTIAKIAALKEAAEISPVAEIAGEADYEKIAGSVIIDAVPTNYFRLSGTAIDAGDAFTEGERSVVISSAVLQLVGFPKGNLSDFVGKRLSIKAFYDTTSTKGVSMVNADALTIKGIVKDDASPLVFIPSNLLSAPPSYQRIFVRAKDLNTVDPLRAELTNMGFVISAKVDLVNQAKQIMNAITIILGVFGVAALVVSAIGMFNTLVIGFLERIFEVGIMKAIGATSGDIRNLFLMESTIMGFLGGIGGIVFGFGIAKIFNLGLNFLASKLGGKAIVLFVFPLQFVLFVIILSGIVGILAGIWPAHKAAKLSAKEAFMRK